MAEPLSYETSVSNTNQASALLWPDPLPTWVFELGSGRGGKVELALPFISCLSLGKSLNLSNVFIYKMRMTVIPPHSTVVSNGLNYAKGIDGAWSRVSQFNTCQLSDPYIGLVVLQTGLSRALLSSSWSSPLLPGGGCVGCPKRCVKQSSYFVLFHVALVSG